ncbi:MAG: hypothetical protein PVI38_18495 [Desulfobacterales bacterium]|jgi:hypothetical protein
MRAPMVFIAMIILFGCAATSPSGDAQTVPNSAHQTAPQAEPKSSDTAKPVKSPHGYIIDKGYERGRFGGFVGDCADDKNWPYFWKCQSENSGNGGFK